MQLTIYCASKIFEGIQTSSLGYNQHPHILIRGIQPRAPGPNAAQDGYECSPTQNPKFA